MQKAIAPVTYAHPRANRQVRLDGAVVAYAFARGKRRTIGFSIGPDGLAVRAPRWTPLGEVDAALQEKAAWILRKLVETRERQASRQQAQVVWQAGAARGSRHVAGGRGALTWAAGAPGSLVGS